MRPRAKAMGFAAEALEFGHASVWRRAERAGKEQKYRGTFQKDEWAECVMAL